MIDVYDIVRPGDRVDIEATVADDKSDDRRYYITKVYDVGETGEVEVIMPMEKTRIVVLSVGAVYDMYFYAGKGIYACSAEVVSRRNENGVAVAVMALNTELRRHQRREYFRYDCVIGMNARALSDEETTFYEKYGKLMNDQQPMDKGVIVDLSGGGMRFVCAQDYKQGGLVHCRFMLNIRNKMNTYDEVVRILFADELANNQTSREYRGQFMKMESGEREEIIRFIFEEERKMRAKHSGM
ncbi:MAG: flagellar brake domain-containing protein [Lachnospiraceae bacterium]|nr:flagellar brake domain-containing protein [Lachnospiraceae bacterium]